jgi:2-polyprenyl-3-methyl-5-hydroxy-6-metoxy-1,4-benzoquinol methylase
VKDRLASGREGRKEAPHAPDGLEGGIATVVPAIFGAADRCPGCGARGSTRLFGVGRDHSLVDCPACALVWTLPPLPEEEVASAYPPEYYGVRNQRFRAALERLIPVFRRRRGRVIESFVPRGRLLDVGCGRGVLPQFLRSRGWEVAGVELTETAAQHARDVLGIPVFVGDFLKCPYGPGSFDALVLWHVLEHLSRPGEALRKCHELLRPGGLLVVAVPNFSSLQAAIGGPYWFHLDVPRHYVHFRLKTLRAALEAAGFRVRKVSHFNLEQNPFGWIQSLLNRLGFRENLLYSLLKHPSARGTEVSAPSLTEMVLMGLALSVVAPLGIGLFLVETALRRGGTVDVYATRAEEDGVRQACGPR